MQVLQVQLEVFPDPAEVGRARRWARSRLQRSGIGADEPLAETLLLLISELVTNAVVHTGCPAVLRMLFPEPEVRDPGADGAGAAAGTVRVEVADASARPPAPRHAQRDETGGRGLELVDGLADRWGWEREGSGKHIWCEVDRCDTAPAAPSSQICDEKPMTAYGDANVYRDDREMEAAGNPLASRPGGVGGIGLGGGLGGSAGSGIASGIGVSGAGICGAGVAGESRAAYLIATGATGLPTPPTNGSGVALSRNA